MILLDVLNTEKALLLSQKDFFGIDKRFKISNLDLIRDIVDIIETLEEFS